mmetsp:Transcript_1864/g.3699  ORF Transcript_1864/g.3699 Transcript_1864/m.3699 type:complete len:100 (+) Transcript_1864:43-342(+)
MKTCQETSTANRFDECAYTINIKCHNQHSAIAFLQEIREIKSRKKWVGPPRYLTMALRRPPTRIELKADDVEEYDRVSSIALIDCKMRRNGMRCHNFCS